MHDDLDLKNDPDNTRPSRTLRMKTPRSSRSLTRRKKTVASFGGNHRRRNKHWSW